MSSYINRDTGQILEKELNHIDKDQNQKRIGLAFSGGGIRSASFGMGIMQALVADDQLKKMDYLSTVSGGGYLGSALTWFLSQKMENGEAFGTKKDDFPFGKKHHGNKNGDSNAILDFIRQHGNYLIPDRCLGPLSLFGTALRTMLVSLAVYFALATSVMSLVLKILPAQNFAYVFLFILVLQALAGITISALYSIYSFFSWEKYKVSVWIQKILGKLNHLMIFALVMGLLPLIHEYIPLLVNTVSGLDKQSGFASESIGVTASASTGILGAILALLSHVRQMQSSEKGVSAIQIVAGAILLLFSLLYGAYLAGLWLQDYGIGVILALSASALVFSFLCNLNYFGLNRMYRDRLMETFMPDRKSIRSGQWGLSSEANKGLVEAMCQSPNQRPYHLINCNIVLTDSDNAKYRGRNGDSFIISPLYCGSDATGWRETNDYMHSKFRNGLTLPTAMAISGAAANPNAGVAGRGVTTNKFVSMLMSLLNLRLGFWANNPRREKNWFPPNYLYPGFKGGVSLTTGLNEYDRAIELSDGGHFENLAIYELLRRHLDIIVVSDAGADGDYTFSDLANAIERVRVDFGINIEFDEQYPLESTMPDSNTKQSEIEKENYHLAKRCFAVAKIKYPALKGKELGRSGYLIYIKPALVSGLSPDVLAYKKLHSTFPHQTTLDQFFTEQQFEAYRELGYYLGWMMLKDEMCSSLL